MKVIIIVFTIILLVVLVIFFLKKMAKSFPEIFSTIAKWFLPIVVMCFFIATMILVAVVPDKREHTFPVKMGKEDPKVIASILAQLAELNGVKRVMNFFATKGEEILNGGDDGETVAVFTNNQAFSGYSSKAWERLARTNGYVKAYHRVDSIWGDFIRSEAKIFGIDPKKVIAIIVLESTINPNDQEGACRGPMQLSYKAACEAAGYKVDTLDWIDPESNIHLGIVYLSQMKQKASGCDDMAVMSYHHGRQGALDSLKNYPGKPRESDYSQYVSAIIKVANNTNNN